MNYKELEKYFLRLDSAYNHLEIMLLNPDIHNALEKGEDTHYYALIENYELMHFISSNIFTPSSTIINSYGRKQCEIGKPFKPYSIKINVDGHSHTNTEEKLKWPGYFVMIKDRVRKLLDHNYFIKSFKAYKNQRDDFPA